MKSFTIQLAFAATSLVLPAQAGPAALAARDAEPGQAQVDAIAAKAKSVFGKLGFSLFRREDYCVQDDYYNALIGFPDINAACGRFLSLPPVTEYAATTATSTTRQVYTTRTITQVQNSLQIPTNTVTVTTTPSSVPEKRDLEAQALARHLRRAVSATSTDFGSAVSSFCSYCVVANQPTTTEYYTLATVTRTVSVQALTTIVSTNLRVGAAKQVTVTETRSTDIGAAVSSSVVAASTSSSSSSASITSAPSVNNAVASTATFTIAQTSTIQPGTPMESIAPLSNPINEFGAFTVGDIIAGNGLTYKLTNTTFTNTVGEGTTTLNVAYSNGTTINYSYSQVTTNTVSSSISQNGVANSNIIINGAVGSTIIIVVNQNGNNAPASTTTIYSTSTIYIGSTSTSASSVVSTTSASTASVTSPAISSTVTIITSNDERSFSSMTSTESSTITSTVTTTSSSISFTSTSVPTLPPFTNTSITVLPTGGSSTILPSTNTSIITSTSVQTLTSTTIILSSSSYTWHHPTNRTRTPRPTGTRPVRPSLSTGFSSTVTVTDPPVPTITPPSNTTSSITLPTGDRSGGPIPPISINSTTTYSSSTESSTESSTATSTSSSTSDISTSSTATACSTTTVSVAAVTITQFATVTQPLTITATQIWTVTTSVPRWKNHNKDRDYWAA